MRQRRTAAALEALDSQIVAELRSRSPQSVRHIFYRMTDPRLPEPVKKTEHGYQQVVHRVGVLREMGQIAWDSIVDTSRSSIRVATYNGLSDFLTRVSTMYRTDPWAQTGYLVKVWTESRSIASVIEKTCDEWRIDLYPSAGFSSKTFIYEGARDIWRQYVAQKHQEVVILYVGDYDPAGCLIDISIERGLKERLREIAGRDVPVAFERIAINEEQIEEYSLPTKPRKASELRRSDIQDTVEAEAMPVDTLNRILGNRMSQMLSRTTLAEIIDRDRTDSLLLLDIARREFGGFQW